MMKDYLKILYKKIEINDEMLNIIFFGLGIRVMLVGCLLFLFSVILGVLVSEER